MSLIRNISQTVQEREIIKTAPDIVVYLDGLPYLLNYYIDDPKTQAHYSIINFNDYVTSFSAGYDTEALVPSAQIGLQVPNYLKHLFQMPGGNNLIQSMMEIQVFAKGYYLANNGDTVYRRVFKGMVSFIGYNDNGKTLEISVQCHGTLHFLELMQININPSVQTSMATGVDLTVFNSIFAHKNPYQIISSMFTYGINTAGFQQTNLGQSNPAANNSRYQQAIKSGYISKWQAILSNVAKDIHIYGTSYKDHPDKSKTLPPSQSVQGNRDKNMAAAASTYLPSQTEPDQQSDLYYKQIRNYQPEMTITSVDLLNNRIISRLEYIRQMIHVIAFEGYQDVDGKIIIKPPLYNLDVTNLGPRNLSTSPNTAGSGDPYSSASNPLTEINDQTNPFIIYLSEILTENETEDQSAIRKTRTVVTGNIDPSFNIGYPTQILPTATWIDIPKLAQFGLREEPTIQVPWIKSDKTSLWAHAIAETVRANRGYRTYTVTIPMRPEIKLGFPIFFPHKDMYGYVKSIQVQYQVGGTATMTIICDSIRRRVMIPQQAKDSNGAYYTSYQSAANLVYKWTKVNSTNGQPPPNQSPTNNLQYFQSLYQNSANGGVSGGNSSQNSPIDPRGKPATLPTTSDLLMSTHDNILQTQRAKRTATDWTIQPDTTNGSYLAVLDNTAANGTVDNLHPNGYYAQPRSVNNSYFVDLMTGTMPFSDGKGYEVLSPFPWGRYSNLRSVIKEFTQDGYILQTNAAGQQVVGPTDINGNPTVSQQDISVLNSTEAFLFAGLGTPTATAHPSNQLIANLAQLQNQSDTDIVVVLDYSSGTNNNDNQLLNTAQPDTQNPILTSLLANTANQQQQVIDVLVSGQVSPNLIARQTAQQIQSPAVGTGATPTAAQKAAAPPTITPGTGGPFDTSATNFEI